MLRPQLYCPVVPSSVEEKYYEHKTFFLSFTEVVKSFITGHSALALTSISSIFCFFLVFINSLKCFPAQYSNNIIYYETLHYILNFI